MKLVNSTPIHASVFLQEEISGEPRKTTLIAKATFTFDTNGSISLDRDNPYPILFVDEETDLGILPQDANFHLDSKFEVILLGAAHSPQPVSQRLISVSVGNEKRELVIFGDREWIPSPSEPGMYEMSSAKPFTRMPLTYSRAFGGSCEVLLDKDAPFTIQSPLNPHGIGFDPKSITEPLSAMLEPLPGYPKFPLGIHKLPNIENPKSLIRNRDDEPEPAGWSTLPQTVPLHTYRRAMSMLEIALQDGSNAREALRTQLEESQKAPNDVVYRAHPDWVIERPEEGSIIKLEGLTPEQRVSFPWPQIKISMDYMLGERSGNRPLSPCMLVLLPEEKRFYIVYRFGFAYPMKKGEERSLRLRLQE